MSGTASIQVDHNFETAHRLPFLGGKCMNLHGHSWRVKVTFTTWQYETGMNDYGVSLEYGLLKKIVRGWIDEHLDHGCMLGVQDPLLPTLIDQDSKLFVFGDVNWLDIPAEEEGRTSYKFAISTERNYPMMPWPTVEATARMIAEKLQAAVDQAFNNILWVEAVNLAETTVNAALWIPSRAGDDRFARHAERLYAADVQVSSVADAYEMCTQPYVDPQNPPDQILAPDPDQTQQVQVTGDVFDTSQQRHQ